MADEPMIPLQWARDHLHEHDEYYHEDAPGARNSHHVPVHLVEFDPPVACPDCDDGQYPCRGHHHRCDSCHGRGTVTMIAMTRDDCPMCWDVRMASLGAAFTAAHTAATRTVPALRSRLAEFEAAATDG